MPVLDELIVKLSADIKGLQAGLKQARSELAGLQNYAERFGATFRRALAAAGLAVGLYEAISLVKRGLTETVKAVDDFHMATISAAATITDMADAGGRDMREVYAGALAYARNMYFELQEAATRFFASGSDLVQAWNILIQKGVLLRKEEIDNLGIVVDKIKLATQGQMGSYQIAQELRALMDGHVNAASQLAMLIKSMGYDVKAIAEEIRRTQSFEPLARILSGLKFASEDIQRTFTSALTTLLSTAKRIAVDSGNVLYQDIVNALKRLDAWLKENRLYIVLAISDSWLKVRAVLTSLWEWAARVGRNIYTVFATVGRDVWNAFGPPVLSVIRVIGQVIVWITNWAAANAKLISTLVQMAIVAKVGVWVANLGAKLVEAMVAVRGLAAAIPSAAAAIGMLGAAARSAWMAFGGWAAAIAVVVYWLGQLGARKWKEFTAEVPSGAFTGAMGEAWGVMSEDTKKELERIEKEGLVPKKPGRGPLTYPEKPPELPPMRPPAAEAPGGGKGGKEHFEDLLRYLMDYLEAKRRLEIQSAEESFQIFKAEQDRKKAELDLALAEGRITGEEYYRAIRQMAEAETAEHLRLIELKIAKEKEAHEWAKRELETRAAEGEISPEAHELLLKKLQIDHAIRLKELEGEAQRERIKLQKEYLELLKEEHRNRQQVEDILASMEYAAALGPVAEKEAEINRLLREQAKQREELIRLGGLQALPRFDQLAKEIELNKRIGDLARGYADAITGFFGDLIDAIISGEQDITKALNRFFRNLFKMGLEPAMKQLTQWLTNIFKQLFGALGEAVMSAIMMVIGLIGMLLTSGGSATWTPSSIQKGVTHHEAVRGIIAGEESIPIAKVGASLQEALVPTNNILRQIEQNTRNMGGSLSLSVTIPGLQEAVAEAMERYFREYLMMGAMG